MYERILVALDGSEIAERVLPHVEALAKAFGSTLILLQATTSPAKLMAELSGGDVDITPAVVDPTEILEEEQQEVGEYLARAAARLRGESGSPASIGGTKCGRLETRAVLARSVAQARGCQWSRPSGMSRSPSQTG